MSDEQVITRGQVRSLADDPWEDWPGVLTRIEDRFWDEYMAIDIAMGLL
jgi:hypothetical protein